MFEDKEVMEKNAFAMQTRFPHLATVIAEKIAGGNGYGPFEVVRTPAEIMTLKAQTPQGPVFLTSQYDPVHSAECFTREHFSASEEVFVLAGVGLGHLPRALLNRMLPSQRLILCEPNSSLLCLQLAVEDFEDLILDARVFWLAADSSDLLIWQLSYLFWKIQAPTGELLVSSGYAAVFPETMAGLRHFLNHQKALQRSQAKLFSDGITSVREKYFDKGMMRDAAAFFSRMANGNRSGTLEGVEPALLFFKEMATHLSYEEGALP